MAVSIETEQAYNIHVEIIIEEKQDKMSDRDTERTKEIRGKREKPTES